MQRLLERLGLGRRDLRAWAMYDWANSAFQTTIVAAIFPIYFQKVAADGMPGPVATSRFAWATTGAILIVAVIAPVLGAVADHAAAKKKLLAVFLDDGAAATGAMFLHHAGRLGAGTALFVVANVGVAGSIVFYESLLPHLVSEDELDRVVGRIRPGLSRRRGAARDQHPHDEQAGVVRPAGSGGCVRASLASVAVWWVLFSIPLFRQVPSRRGGSRRERRNRQPSRHHRVHRLLETFRELRRHRQAFIFLLAFLLYNDGIQTIIRMATIYGTEIGTTRTR